MRQETDEKMRGIFGDELTDAYLAYMAYGKWHSENGGERPRDVTMEALAKFAYFSDLDVIPNSDNSKNAEGTLVENLRSELETARSIICDCAKAVGAAVSPECSIGFMSEVPNEIRSVLAKTKLDVDRLSLRAEHLRDSMCVIKQEKGAMTVLRIASEALGFDDALKNR